MVSSDHQMWNMLKFELLSVTYLSVCVLIRRRFDLQNPSRMDRNVEMFMNIEKTLAQVRYIPEIVIV